MKKETDAKKTDFEATGSIFENGSTKRFSKVVRAHNESNAKEMVFALFGSNNKLKRNRIVIQEIKKVKEAAQ